MLLLDEPFGALDALTRAQAAGRADEASSQTTGSTVLMVTHDVDEAVLLADRIVMMTNGPAATIGEILDVDLPRPRDRVALAENPRYHHYRTRGARLPLPPPGARRGGVSLSDRDMATREAAARRRRQRHGRHAHARGAAEARAGPLRHHGVRRRAASELQPHPALAGARRRADARRDRAERRATGTREQRHRAARRQDGRRASTACAASSRPTTARAAPYDRLLLATGSNPFILPVPGDGPSRRDHLPRHRRHRGDDRRGGEHTRRGRHRRRPARARGRERAEARAAWT